LVKNRCPYRAGTYYAIKGQQGISLRFSNPLKKAKIAYEVNFISPISVNT